MKDEAPYHDVNDQEPNRNGINFRVDPQMMKKFYEWAAQLQKELDLPVELEDVVVAFGTVYLDYVRAEDDAHMSISFDILYEQISHRIVEVMKVLHEGPPVDLNLRRCE